MKSKKNIILKLYITLFVGFFLCSLGMVMILYADLGADPWLTFQKSISNITGVSFGRITQLVGLIVIIIGVFLKIPPGLATILNMYFIGFFMDFIENSDILFTPHTFAGKIFLLCAGMIIFSIGSWLYLKNGLGAGPRDGLMLGLMKKLNLSVAIVKTSIEVTVLTIGILLGGPVGIGTLITAFGNGVVLDKTFQIVKFDSKNTYQRNFQDELESIKYYKKQRQSQEKQ